jgi:hypothetical protein
MDGWKRRAKTMLVGLLMTSGYVVRANAATDKEEDSNNFREDVILCEEAVAHASACCNFKVQGDACQFYHYYSYDSCGCDSPGTDGSERKDIQPVLSAKAARRIADMDCETMKQADADGATTCSRVYADMQKQNSSSSSTAKNCH